MSVIKKTVSWHNKIGWFGAVGILIWVLSGITHPLMSWFGPKSEKFFPPSVHLVGSDFEALPTLLNQEIIGQAKVIKIVPSQQGPLLQVTRSENEPRQYFQLQNGEQIAEYDREQAKWLASYYSGRANDDISKVSFQTEFDKNYPWVNRLLPVYKVQFKHDDNLVLYVHTETLALASITNQFKRNMQFVFQQLHTFKWLENIEFGRVILIVLFMLCLLGIAVTGVCLVLQLKARRIPKTDRRLHRWLAYFLWLPLLAWSASGFYHLIQQSVVKPVSGLRLSDTPLNIPASAQGFKWPAEFADVQIASVSLVRGVEGNPLYRVSVRENSDNENISRKQRYKGKPSETKAVYLDAATGSRLSSISDAQIAKHLAIKYSRSKSENVMSAKLITRYSPRYDFRNKRLPVWQVSLDNASKQILFIDPITGVLVDQSRAIDRLERFSFSMLHKWNFLNPFIGRFNRDLLIVATLIFLLAMAAFGVSMLFNRKKAKNTNVNMMTSTKRVLS